jgi:hypothetical protein
MTEQGKSAGTCKACCLWSSEKSSLLWLGEEEFSVGSIAI